MDASDLPKTNAQTNQTPSPNEPTKHNKRNHNSKTTTYQMKLWRRKVAISIQKHKIAGTKAAFKFFTQRVKRHNRSEKKKDSQENAVGKNAKRRYSALFIGGHTLGKPNVQAKCHHWNDILPRDTQGRRLVIKAFFGFRTPTRHVAQSDEETYSVFKKPVIFNPLIF